MKNIFFLKNKIFQIIEQFIIFLANYKKTSNGEFIKFKEYFFSPDSFDILVRVF